MQGVPEQFIDEKDSARFRHLAQIPGVELYHAHISRYAFEPHTHEAFGIGAIEAGAERFRYRGTQYVAPAHSVVTMNPDELHTGEAETADGWRYRMIYLEPSLLQEVTGIRHWWFHDVTRHDPHRSRQICSLIHGMWNTEDPLAQKGLLLDLIDTNRLAEAFYRDHGVRLIERGLDLAPTTAGHVVLRSAYCIRPEIGV